METHHIHKLDAPSGTAITLAEGIIENVDRKDRWTLETAEKTTDIPIHAIRKGEVPGIHEITYESDVDTISIKHDAKSRARICLGRCYCLPNLLLERKVSSEWMICLNFINNRNK